jgi:hypothetical protein
MESRKEKINKSNLSPILVLQWLNYPAHVVSFSRQKLKIEGNCKAEVIPVDVVKTYEGSKRIAPPILNRGTRWKWFVSIKPGLSAAQKIAPVPIHCDAGWIQLSLWMLWRRQNPLQIKNHVLTRMLFFMLL